MLPVVQKLCLSACIIFIKSILLRMRRVPNLFLPFGGYGYRESDFGRRRAVRESRERYMIDAAERRYILERALLPSTARSL